jgi:hypothetical protein
VTDQFGLYRVNSLVPGTYQFVLEFVDDSGNNRKVSKEVVVTNQFLFGQDIVVQDGAGEEISLVEPTVPKVTVINDNFEAVDKASAVVVPAIVAAKIAKPYGPEFNVTDIPVAGCPAGSSASFIQLASYTDLTVALKKLAEYSIDNSFIDFYDGKNSSAMRQYRIAVGPFTESEQDLAARAKRYDAITNASSWTRYRACDDVRHHPPVNAN